MAETPDHTLEPPRQMRAEIKEGFAKVDAQNEKHGTLAQTLVSVQRDIRELKGDVVAVKISVDNPELGDGRAYAAA